MNTGRTQRQPTTGHALARLLLTGTLATLIASTASAQQAMDFEPLAGAATDISFMVGTWHVTEVIYPGEEREYVETSVRSCQWALAGTYVQCHIEGSARGRQRESLWMINQPGGPPNIEILGVFSNIAVKSIYRGQFLPDGSGIDMRNYEIEGDEFKAGTYQRLRFLSAEEFEWHIGIKNPGTADESVIGIERAVRVSATPQTR